MIALLVAVLREATPMIYVAMAAVLLLRPNGLLGRAT